MLMRVFFLIAFLIPAAAHAQNAGLESLLESQLSTEDRQIEIDGFAGALSAQATMDALRVSDADGVWLELTDLQLDWNRGALLRGRLEVQQLTAASVSLLRPPLPAEGIDPPAAEASGFRIPDLPVAIQVDRLAVERLSVGEAVLGEAIEATISLSAALDDGGLSLTLVASRLDNKQGDITLAASFDPESEALAVDLVVSEPAEGVVARALSLPGLPSVDLTVAGEGALDDFRADLALRTDGADRLGGTVVLAAADGGRAFSADLSGDIRPLLDAGSRDFFGSDTRLDLQGIAATDGALELNTLSIAAENLSLSGSAALAADGAPERFDLEGQIGRGERLALPGSDVTLTGADLDLFFDASVSDQVTFDITARAVETGGNSVEVVNLTGEGVLDTGSNTPFEGDITANLTGLATPSDPAITEALGSELQLTTTVTATDAGGVQLSDIDFASASLTATGAAEVVPTDGRFALAAAIAAEAPDLAPFSGLAGQDLSGTVSADATIEAELPGGAIAVSLVGRSEGIDIGVPEAEPLLLPASELSIALRRDESGTRIEDFELQNPELTARLSGSVSGEDGGIALTARLREIGLFTDLVEGPVEVEVTIDDLTGDSLIDGGVRTDFGLVAQVTGALAGASPAVQLTGALSQVERFAEPLTGTADLTVAVDLAPEFPLLDLALAAQPGVNARVTGPLSGPGQAFSVLAEIADLGAFAGPLPGPASLNATISDLSNGPLIDAVLQATPGIEARILGRPTGEPDVEGIDLDAQIADLSFLVPQLAGPATVSARLDDLLGDLLVAADISASPGLTATVEGRPLGEASELTLNARLAALAPFAPGLSGGATLTAQATDLTSTPSLTAELATDSGARTTVSGQVNLPGGAVDITAVGDLPLAIAQSFIGERSLDGRADFDVALRGQPSLANLTGRASIREGRFFDPANSVALQPITADVSLSGGQASVDAVATLEGAPINIAGSAGLSAPFPVDITVNGTRIPVRYADILENRTTLALRLQGAAQQQLSITGDVSVADTEIRIPDTGLGSAPPIPAIRHDRAPGDVRQTLRRAGIDLSGVDQAAGASGPNIPLDIRLTATTPIFVRGRGMDASFDGGVRVTGSVADPVPIGELGLLRGRLDFLGRRLDLTEGTITIAGALIPRIDIVAQTTVEEITAQIALNGPVDNPELALSSSPELPEDEILARVLFGRGIETLSAFQVARLVNSVRKLSGRGGDGVLDDARSSLGVDNFDLRTDAATGEAELAIGATLSENLYTEVELGAAGSTTINLNFDLNSSTRLQGSASSEGETGIGIFWERDY